MTSTRPDRIALFEQAEDRLGARSVRLTEGYIRRQAPSRTFRRGEDARSGGHVMLMTCNDRFLEALVNGRELMPYHVKVKLDTTGVKSATCSCPHDEGDWCAHVVATLLVGSDETQARADDQAQVEQAHVEQALDERLGELSRWELEALLFDAYGALPQFAAHVDRALEADTAKAARTATIPMRNLAALSEWPLPTVDRTLRELFEAVLALLARDKASQALRKLEVLTDVVLRQVEHTADDDDLNDFAGLVSRVWIDAAIMTEPAGSHLKQLAKRLGAWRFEFQGYGVGEELYVSQLMFETGFPLTAADLDGPLRGEFEQARLRVFARRRQIEEYLRLARRIDPVRYLAMLVHAGQFERAVKDGLKLLRGPDQALDLVRLLLERERVDDALLVGEHGLKLTGAGLAQLGRVMRDLASAHGQWALALRAAQTAVLHWPTLDDYLTLGSLAGSAWTRSRAAILKSVEASANDEGVVRILLHEGQVARAIARIDKLEYPAYDLTDAVVRAAIPVKPAWAAATARKYAAEIMDRRSSERYHHAGRWLSHVRAALHAAGDEAGWQLYRSRLLLQHARKPKLRPIIAALR